MENQEFITINTKCCECNQYVDKNRKNNWGYWTERKEDKELYKCNKCLENFYRGDRKVFLETIPRTEKRRAFAYYIQFIMFKN